MKNKILMIMLLGIMVSIFSVISVSAATCEDCGNGLWNICDMDECNSLGDNCLFFDNSFPTPNECLTIQCYDSDGANPDNRGFVQLYAGDWEDEKLYDYCKTGFKVAEYLCDNLDIIEETYDCPFGCNLGKCGDKPSGCIPEGKSCGVVPDEKCCKGLECRNYKCSSSGGSSSSSSGGGNGDDGDKKSNFNMTTILIIAGIGLIGYALFSGNKKRGKKK